MAAPVDAGDASPQLTFRELQTRKSFVGLELAATRALQAMSPWMEAHVHVHLAQSTDVREMREKRGD